MRVSVLLLSSLIAASALAEATPPTADDLVLVDCRLAPKIRRIGGRTYTVAGKPVRTTAVDCRIRGGEYTIYDRSNYATSLKIWRAAAEKDDAEAAEAAYYVGKLYEGGLGTEPDYKSAAMWYEKAAKAGHSASQFSLAALYEKGWPGVPPDPAKAIALYRSASGLPPSITIVETDKYEALEKAANELALREQQIEELQRQLDAAKKQIKRDETRENELLKKLDDERRKSESQKSEMARIQKSLPPTEMPPGQTRPGPPPSNGRVAQRANLGRFFALVIGNGRYEHLPPLATAVSDAKAMAAVLRDQYGFKVTLRVDATNAQILTDLYQLSQDLAENDNLVIYYAGHGKRDLRNRRGWWMPSDAGAEIDAKTNWLPNQEVSDRLALVHARHILVLADASYVGDITRGAPAAEPQSMTPAQWTSYVDATKRKRARLALSSGTDGASSRFTTTLINVLQRQQGVVPASRIHREVVNALTAGSGVSSAVPTFAPMQSASHEGVDFLFERK